MIMSRRNLLLLLFVISCSIHAVAQTYYYHDSYGTKKTLTLNENKVCVSIPKDCKETSERICSNVQVLYNPHDTNFDIYFITRSDFEKLNSLDSWEEDAKSVIVTPSYFGDLTASNQEVFSTPYVLVKLKKEEDEDLLTPYIEKYSLKISMHSPYLPLAYILALTLDSGKSPLEIGNEMFESGNFARSYLDLALAGNGACDPTSVRSITAATAEESSEIYDLQGRRLSTIPQKGVYIQNGRKKLVK